nr:mucin-5AC isoform X1 [Drosophila bipectinata]
MLHSNYDNAQSTTTTTTTPAATTTTTTASAKAIDGAVSPLAVAVAAAEGQTVTGIVASADLAPSAVPERSELSETADAAAAASATGASGGAVVGAASEVPPAFDAQMRTQQRQKIKSYHDAKQTAVWQTDSLASTSSPDFAAAAGGGGIGPGRVGPNVCVGLPMRSIILSTAPSLLQRKSSDSSLAASSIPRRVSFPENELVTGYLEPANPWKQVYLVKNNADVVDQYVQSCQKHNTQPIKNVMDQLRNLDLHQARQPLLSLKEIQLAANDCEALEEIFKRVQYKCIDLSDCTLDENCLTALFQMIEYYEAANELDISYNKEQMTKRCWELCAYMVGRSQELHSLNAECNQITKLGAVSLGHALGTSNLHTLKLEHCGLSGQPLINLCRGLNHNKMLKELWMGYNDLDCVDAQHIADMLRFNHSMELIDISNNNIRNEGVMYLVQALVLQSTELERRMGALKRTRAIEVDECTSPVEAEPPTVIPESVHSSSSPEKDDVDKESSLRTTVPSCPEAMPEEEAADESVVPVLVDLDNDNDDDNTEDTVRIVKNSGTNGGSGQSMLDKLLSMNSDSSSEEAPSNISTDTLAACCSEDISEISNEIFDATATKQPPIESVKETIPAEGSTPQSEVDTAPSAETLTSTVPVSEEPLSPAQQQQHSSQNERNLCDITPSTEAKTVEPNESCVQNNIINNNNNNNQAHNNTYNNNNVPSPTGAEAGAVSTLAVVDAPPTVEIASNRGSPPAAIFEVTAEESDCINGSGAGASGSRPLDVNKNAKVGDDFEDTHSTDSAFESASEGDISRNLPDEFSRLSVSLESTRLDLGGIETGTIASESTECLILGTTPTKADEPEVFSPPKVTISEESLLVDKDLSPGPFSCPSPAPTPPPPSTSPGGASIGLRRTESSCAYLNQSTRNRSQSSDSLCSETSQDSSTAAPAAAANDPKFAEKLTKNDTLSRRQQADCTLEAIRSPSGLKALTVWNNNLTKDCANAVSELLQKTISLELLNIGKNCLSNDFVATIKDSLTKNTTLTTLGLQSAHLSAKGIETLASILTFGGNSKLQRIDIRDNKLEVESLNIIAEVLKSNKTLTQIDINDEPKRLTLPIVPIVNVIPPSPLPQDSIGSDAHLDYTRVLGTVRSLCSRNEKRQAQELADRSANVGGGGSSAGGSFPGSRCRGGYYLGSRKISLTCHSRPFVDAVTGTVIAKPAANATASAAATATPTPAALLEVKRKGGSRLRSPGPSPPTVSPSSSPNRSRFHVSRVPEVASPLMSPLAQPPLPHAPHTPRSASSCMSIPTIAGSPGGSQSSLNTVGALPTSSSLPAMASVTSSTQTIKRLSVSPRSRFHVSRIYEDPQVPIANRQLPPITPHTPPLDLPPTPMLKSARKAVQLTEAVEAAAAAVPASSVVILEPSDPHGDTLDNSTKADEAAGQKLLSNSPTLSSSSSTSPGSSNSSGSSNGTSSITSNDSIISGAEAHPPPLLTCPLAVFGDNDITLTKESAAVVAGHLNPVLEAKPASEPAPPAEPIPNPPVPARKTSWIANPSAVDKLLTIFNTGNIFQRSSSPESKASQVSASAVTNNSQNGGTATSGGAIGGDGCSAVPNPTLSTARKISPASWTSLTGSNISNSSQNAASNVDTGSSSILETASRQLRDFSKQVFRQNISFNNSGDATSSGTVAPLEGISTATSSSSSTESPSPPECNAAHMPSSLKRQLKENISPEHTINEETLHTLQKLSRAEDVALKAEAAAELGDIEIVMHSEVVDCRLPEEKQEEQEEAAQSLV